jgi:hypothetical protein
MINNRFVLIQFLTLARLLLQKFSLSCEAPTVFTVSGSSIDSDLPLIALHNKELMKKERTWLGFTFLEPRKEYWWRTRN